MRGLLLLAALLSTACLSRADEDLCVGRCEEGFNNTRKCQCDPLCVYYQSCCSDYETTCKQKVTRGDVFALPEDEYALYDEVTETPPIEEQPMPTEPMETEPGPTDLVEIDPVATDLVESELEETEDVMPDPVEIDPVQTEVPIEKGPEQVLENTEIPPTMTSTAFSVLEPKPSTTDTTPSPQQEETEDACSQKPFDAFTDLKNGSIFAFRGKYCYELDEKKVLDGYPKLIEDVWGIPGPIDAAFTRINCQGKTYIFKGNQYWRFHNGILDPEYPRNISNGFQKIPGDIDAAFAVPAKDYRGRERAYFFKGGRYWEYNFKNQPGIQECQASPPSQAFTQYAFMQSDSVWSEFFQQLYGDSALKSGTSDAKSISRGWRGLPSNLDAAVAGRIYMSQPSKPQTRRSSRRKSRKNRKRYQLRKRKSWSSFFDWMSEEDDDDFDFDPDWQLPITQQCQPIQSVYFFKKDKYYRVNLQKKRVDYAFPGYPRSIAQYWLGCRNVRRLK